MCEVFSLENNLQVKVFNYPCTLRRGKVKAFKWSYHMHVLGSVRVPSSEGLYA